MNKKNVWKKSWPIALAGVIGLGVGGAVMQGETPDPVVETKEIEVVKEVEVADPTCQEAAAEIWDILDVAVNDALLPYSDITITLADQLQYGADMATINDATAKVQGITETMNNLTPRVQAIRPTYEECVAQ